MIQEAYVSFEIAKLLKNKGFDIFISFGWDSYRDKQSRNFIDDDGRGGYHDNKFDWISCPTHQMAMAWLREMQIDIVVFHERLPENCYWARIEKYPYTEHQQEPVYQTYEDAVEAALKYALENLI